MALCDSNGDTKDHELDQEGVWGRDSHLRYREWGIRQNWQPRRHAQGVLLQALHQPTLEGYDSFKGHFSLIH